MNCLFCCDADTDDKPVAGKDLICPLCVRMLLAADQEDLKRAHSAAIERGYERKARAIMSFLIPGGETNAQRKPNSKKRGRHSNRKRIDRAIRDKKKRPGRS